MPFDLGHREELRLRVQDVRGRSLQIAAPLSAEDMSAQAMADASPIKWHLAHTTWFFAEFVLGAAADLPPSWRYLFNSYYECVGARFARASRGLITRPSIDDIVSWRRRIDEALDVFIAHAPSEAFVDLAPLIDLGLHHEEQHQELMLTDVLALFAAHPDVPAYRVDLAEIGAPKELAKGWTAYECGVVQVGASAHGFAFDCERPRHRAWIEPFAIADQLVTNADWLGFIEDGAYSNPLLWLSDGWACVRRENWVAPGYWRSVDGAWRQATLAGLEALHLQAPVSHISFWEADAFARWSGARLPREAEWEVAAGDEITGNVFETDRLRPAPRDAASRQFLGDVWEWTQSAFAPYPGFKRAPGAVGEYNGKFMAAQFVLRGGSCLTPRTHIRASYRNFFYPHQRWQMTGLRLAKDLP